MTQRDRTPPNKLTGNRKTPFYGNLKWKQPQNIPEIIHTDGLDQETRTSQVENRGPNFYHVLILRLSPWHLQVLAHSVKEALST